MAKTQILLPFNGQNLPYFIDENNIFHIENELFVLTDKVTINDKFGQLSSQKKNSILIHIKSGIPCFDFYRHNVKVNKLRLKNDTKNYIFELLTTYVVSNMDNEKFFKAINNAKNINDISAIESRYFSSFEKKKPILQKLGKYKITDNSLLSYSAELVISFDSKNIISEFKKWVKFVNEVALFSGYKAELTNKSGNIYTCTIVHDKGQYKFDLYLSDTMLFDFKQCLGISEIKHEINQNSTDTMECINNNIEPKIEAKNSVIIVSDSVYNTMLSNLLVNVAILNPIKLIKSNVNFEPPIEKPTKVDKDFITIEYPKGYIPPCPKKITKLDNKDIIYYEPIKSNETKLIVTANGILVELPTNFKIDSMDSTEYKGFILPKSIKIGDFVMLKGENKKRKIVDIDICNKDNFIIAFKKGNRKIWIDSFEICNIESIETEIISIQEQYKIAYTDKLGTDIYKKVVTHNNIEHNDNNYYIKCDNNKFRWHKRMYA